MKITCLLRALSLALLGSLLVACTALPNVNNLSATLASNAVPSIGTGQGGLSEQSASALLRKRWANSTLDLKTQASLEEAASGGPLLAGNKVTLLFDGPQTMEQMLKAIAAATDHINLETYIFDQDAMGLKFADMLIEKQQQGIAVSIMYDSVGTLAVPQEFFERMRSAGVKLIAFNPVNPAKVRGDSWRLNNRDHRKVLIVDGKIAFTGGVNISDTYAKSSLFRARARQRVSDASEVGWRDTHVMVEGPAVAAFQWMFIRAWTLQDADDLPDARFFPPLAAVGDKLVRVIASEPGGDFAIYKAYILAMQAARQSIYLTSAYFVPDQQTIAALTDAAKRGVDVKLVLPGISDSSLVFHASHAFYDALLEGGVRIYQLKLSVLHAKTAVIDGNWSTVGSTNIDMRSFMHNSELNLVVLGEAFGDDMENAFAEDLDDSIEITQQQWRQRPLGDRIKEWAARFVGYWL
jgi:cardiolipin synthase